MVNYHRDFFFFYNDLDIVNESLTWEKEGLWDYIKYPDGTYLAKTDQYLELDIGTAFLGGYYHKQTSPINLPSFANDGFRLISATKNDSKLSLCVGVESTSGKTLQTYWINGVQDSMAGSFFGIATLTILGTY